MDYSLTSTEITKNAAPTLIEKAARMTYEDTYKGAFAGVLEDYHYRIVSAYSEGMGAYYYQLVIEGMAIFENGVIDVGPFGSASDAIAAGREHFRQWVGQQRLICTTERTERMAELKSVI